MKKALITGINKSIDKIYSKKWLDNALKEDEFINKPYLEFTNYNSYSELNKLVKIVELVELMQIKKGVKPIKINILEIGCGTGNICIPLASKGYNVIGIDLNKNAITKANQIKKSKKLNNVNFFVKNTSEYFCSDSIKKFDIIASDILEHLQNPINICTSIFDNLEGGGFFIVTIPNGLGLSELLINNFSKNVRKILGEVVDDGYNHIQRFTINKINLVLTKSGFKQIKFICNIDFITFFPFINRSILARIDFKISKLIPTFLANRWIFLAIKTDD